MSACDGPSISKPRNNDRTTEKQGKREMGKERERERKRKTRGRKISQTQKQSFKMKKVWWG